jgi:hypothetical protein
MGTNAPRPATNQMARIENKEVWWLVDGTEICPGCRQAYAYHVEYRCVDCDGPRCPICVQTSETMEAVCEGCFQSRSSEGVKP